MLPYDSARALKVEQDHMELARTQVEAAHKRIARQQGLLAKLRRDGHPVGEGESILHTMRDTLAQMEAHLKSTERRIDHLKNPA